VQLWRNHQRLDHNLPLAQLLQADAATLTIDNQKNGQRGSTIHHEALPGNPTCPVSAVARRVHAVRQVTPSPTAPLSLHALNQHITAPMMTAVLRQAAVRLNLHQQGYPSARIGSHSLRASGAMAMKLNGESDVTIMKYGRWRSTTWMTYIHSQISAFAAGVAARMSRPIVFYNVGAGAPR
jgi:hypothetical protein